MNSEDGHGHGHGQVRAELVGSITGETCARPKPSPPAAHVRGSQEAPVIHTDDAIRADEDCSLTGWKKSSSVRDRELSQCVTVPAWRIYERDLLY